MHPDKDDFLDDFFDDAKSVHAPVGADLMARVMADAQPRSVWRTVRELIGGWPAMGGMVAAGVAGLWIGMAPPDVLTTLTTEMIGRDMELDLWSDVSLGTEDWING